LCFAGLLTDLQRDGIEVVLVSPRNPLNIGAAARAMANFGLDRLAVVAPYAPTWREARSAVGAPEILLKAKEYATLGEAVAECTVVFGTGSLTYRKPQQPVVPLPDLAPLVGREVARGGRVAVVFGPEKHGLTSDDLSFCHFLVEIPTDSRQPSMNLGQAVAVCLYELATRIASGAPVLPGDAAQPENVGLEEVPGKAVLTAHSGHLDLLAGLIEQAMLASGYISHSIGTVQRLEVRHFLRRITLSEIDARWVLGLFRRILWRLEHSRSAKEK
jgi:tRNA/rRNA methyltransferase